MIAVQTGSKTLAENTEKNVIKLCAKTYFLWEKGLITVNTLHPLEDLTHRVVKLLYVLYLNLDKLPEKQREPVMVEKFTLATQYCHQMGTELKSLLEPHLTPKSLALVDAVLDVFSKQDFYMGVWKNPSLRPDIDKTMDIAKNVLGWEAAQCDNVGLLFDTNFSFRGGKVEPAPGK